MTEEGQTTTALDRKADRILEEIGLDPEGPPSQYTNAAGLEFGRRFGEMLPTDQRVFNELVREVLTEFAAVFPLDPDAETLEFQAYMLGPIVSGFLAGRGMTLPELAVLANVSSQRAYRLNRKALTLIYAEKEPPTRTGVNRRYSGRDERETHHVVDPHGFAKRAWPAPIDSVQPFVLGAMTGLQECLGRAEIRAELEPRFKRALAKLLRDPGLGDLMDGVLLALDRIAQGLRDTAPGQPGPILKMKAEREKSVQFQAMLAELSRQRPLVLAELARAGRKLGAEVTQARPSPRPAPLPGPRKGNGLGRLRRGGRTASAQEKLPANPDPYEVGGPPDLRLATGADSPTGGPMVGLPHRGKGSR
jgi:hypothetical protein